MTEESKTSFVDIVRQSALDLGLPKVGVDTMVAAQKKNWEALAETARIASEGAKAVAAKHKETVDSAIRETFEAARSMRLVGDPKAMLAKQEAAVGRALDAAVSNTRLAAEWIQRTNADAFKVVADRFTESVAEIRRSFPTQANG